MFIPFWSKFHSPLWPSKKKKKHAAAVVRVATEEARAAAQAARAAAAEAGAAAAEVYSEPSRRCRRATHVCTLPFGAHEVGLEDLEEAAHDALIAAEIHVQQVDLRLLDYAEERLRFLHGKIE